MEIGTVHSGNIATQNALYRSVSPQSTVAEPVAAALRRPAERLERENESVQVQLSALGRVQSAVADVQNAGRDLADLRPEQQVDSVRETAKAFVESYNAERRVLAEQGQRPVADNEAAPRSDDGAARRVAEETRNEIDTRADALRQIGISAQADGSLSFDADTFNTALTRDAASTVQALNDLGQGVQESASRQLNQSGSVGQAVASLTVRADQIQSQQSELQSRFEASQRAVQEQLQRLSQNPFNPGVATYERIFSL